MSGESKCLVSKSCLSAVVSAALVFCSVACNDNVGATQQGTLVDTRAPKRSNNGGKSGSSTGSGGAKSNDATSSSAADGGKDMDSASSSGGKDGSAGSGGANKGGAGSGGAGGKPAAPAQGSSGGTGGSSVMDTAGTGGMMMSTEDCDSINNGDQRLQCFSDALNQVEPQACRDCEMANAAIYMESGAMGTLRTRCFMLAGNITSGNWSGSSRAEACVRMLTCIRKSGCAANQNMSDCVCKGKDGSALSDAQECFSRPSLAALDGPCKDQAIASAEIAQNGSVQDLGLRFTNEQYACGLAQALVLDDMVYCGAPCNACTPGVTCSATDSTGGSGGTSGASGAGSVAGHSGAPGAGTAGASGIAGH